MTLTSLSAGLLWDCPISEPRGGGRNRHQRAAEHLSDLASLIFNVALMNCSAVLLDWAISHGEAAELNFPFNLLKLTFSSLMDVKAAMPSGLTVFSGSETSCSSAAETCPPHPQQTFFLRLCVKQFLHCTRRRSQKRHVSRHVSA